jgi:hypothetical protein
VLSASLPTGAYSPTAVIPLELCVSPPRSSRTEKHALLEDVEMSSDTDTDTSSECPSPSRSVYSEPDTVAIFRVTLVREERVGNALVHSVPIVARIGWLPLSRPAGGASARPALPLMLDGAWTHGYSTLLAGDAEGMHTARQSLSSTFALYIDVLFHSARGRVQTCDDAAKGDQPPYLVAHAPLLPLASGGGLTAAVDGSAGQRLWERVALLAPAAPRTLAVPIIIGSVSEPRDALYMHSWSDLQLTDGQDTSSPNAPPGRLIEGEALSNEDGWLCPPPCYATAIQDAPHVC